MSEDWAEETRTVGYQRNVTLALNQKPGTLYPLAGSSGTYSDKSEQLEDRFDDLYLSEKTTRNGDTNNTDMNSVRRWAKKPKSANVAPLRDRDDALATTVDIDSPIVSQTRRAASRYHDEQYVKGYFGTAWTGEHGDVAVPFNSSNLVPHNLGGTSAGITEDKLIMLSEMYEANDVDTEEEMPIVLLTPQGVSDLMRIERYVNSRYDGKQVLATRELKPWQNLRFFRVNLRSVKAFPEIQSLIWDSVNNVVRLPTFVPSGMHRAVWTEFYGKITERADKQHSMQVYAEACSTATRLDEAKCIVLESKERA